MFPNVEELKHPPVIGEVYSVLCMRITTLYGGSMYLPVFGEGHVDEFDFGDDESGNPGPHGHHDTRFFTDKESKATGWDGKTGLTFYMKAGTKLNGSNWTYHTRRELREMVREFPPNLWGKTSERIKLEKKYEDHKLNLNCKRCPHQGANLDSVPVLEGKILCPFHNLMWDAEDGSLVRKMQDPNWRDR